MSNKQKTYIMRKLTVILLSALIFTFNACKKENNEQQMNTIIGEGRMNLEIEHRWGPTMAPFSMNTWLVHPQTGDSLNFNNIQYYITNLRLKKSDGTWWTEIESYRLIDAKKPDGMSFTVSNIPAGEYTEIQFMIGVDSARNLMGIQSGVLDPSLGMFWTWQTGYIFIKAEGIAPAAPQGNFQYHLGGFTDPFNAIQIRTFNIGTSPLRIVKDASSKIIVRTNLARFWHGGVRVADTHTIHMPGLMATQMAANFAEGFIISQVVNP